MTLNNADNIGFLIQARTRSEAFVVNSDIWGEWLPDPLGEGGTPRYKPLECGRNMANPLPVFPVSLKTCHSPVTNAFFMLRWQINLQLVRAVVWH